MLVVLNAYQQHIQNMQITYFQSHHKTNRQAVYKEFNKSEKAEPESKVKVESTFWLDSVMSTHTHTVR